MSVRYYLDEQRFRLVGRQESPDLFLGSQRFGCQDQVQGRVIHTVQRMNTPLVVVKRVGEIVSDSSVDATSSAEEVPGSPVSRPAVIGRQSASKPRYVRSVVRRRRAGRQRLHRMLQVQLSGERQDAF
jgi:hypothetical protein